VGRLDHWAYRSSRRLWRCRALSRRVTRAQAVGLSREAPPQPGRLWLGGFAADNEGHGRGTTGASTPFLSGDQHLQLFRQLRGATKGHYRTAWIVQLPPAPRHPQTRWQVRYRDGTTQRSAGISPTRAEACSVKRAVEHGDHVAISDQLSPTRPPTPRCCSASRSSPSGGRLAAPPTPRPAGGTSSELSARILPRFGDLALAQLDTHVVATRRHDLTREGLSSRTIATYVWLLGTVCNAAVDTDTWTAPAPAPQVAASLRPSPPPRPSHPCRA
jgi:hypothetical protein